jgi:hypothetical protein
MLKIWKYIFGDWNKWQDVSCTESLGWIGIVQTRTEKRTGKRQIRKKRIWVNDYSKISEIKANMFRG